MSLLIEEYLLDAVATISAGDVPDVEFADAVNAEIRYLANIPSDDYWAGDSETSIQ